MVLPVWPTPRNSCHHNIASREIHRVISTTTPSITRESVVVPCYPMIGMAYKPISRLSQRRYFLLIQRISSIQRKANYRWRWYRDWFKNKRKKIKYVIGLSGFFNYPRSVSANYNQLQLTTAKEYKTKKKQGWSSQVVLRTWTNIEKIQ